MEMKEFTLRAVLIGLLLTGILGAANAYLGLKAGMTIAATYPAAVIGMAADTCLERDRCSKKTSREPWDRLASRWRRAQCSRSRHS